MLLFFSGTSFTSKKMFKTKTHGGSCNFTFWKGWFMNISLKHPRDKSPATANVVSFLGFSPGNLYAKFMTPNSLLLLTVSPNKGWRIKTSLVVGWSNPTWKHINYSQLGSLPQASGWKQKTYLKPPPGQITYWSKFHQFPLWNQFWSIPTETSAYLAKVLDGTRKEFEGRTARIRQEHHGTNHHDTSRDECHLEWIAETLGIQSPNVRWFGGV